MEKFRIWAKGRGMGGSVTTMIWLEFYSVYEIETYFRTYNRSDASSVGSIPASWTDIVARAGPCNPYHHTVRFRKSDVPHSLHNL